MQTLPLIPSVYARVGLRLMTICGTVGLLFLVDAMPLQLKIPMPTTFANTSISNGELPIWMATDILPTLCGIGFLLGGCFVMLARQSHEDELTKQLRLNALLWAVVANYLLLITLFLGVWGFAFLSVMIWHLFTTPLIFSARFYFLLHRLNRSLPTA